MCLDEVLNCHRHDSASQPETQQPEFEMPQLLNTMQPSTDAKRITPEAFRAQLAKLTSQIAGKDLNHELQAWLNANHGHGSDTFRALEAGCRAGVADGWLCNREAGGVRYGRIFKPEAALSEFSVDVVDMQDVVGPHHVHPEGEIDLVMPIDGEALFDGHPAGWVVYSPGSAHRPTVSKGRALVLYLLPKGAIRFTS
jgi:hypothetical protein